MQVVYKLFFILLIILQQGCESLTQNSELDKMSNKELEEYFLKHKNKLKNIVDTCEKYPSIMRVEKNRSKYYTTEVSDETKKQIKDIQNIVVKLKIDNVQCGRNEQLLNNKLTGISFCLYSAGIVVSGESQSIDYRTKRFSDFLSNRKKINIPWQTIFPLPEEGWSIVNTK